MADFLNSDRFREALRTVAASPPASFLNPLTPLRLEREGMQIATGIAQQWVQRQTEDAKAGAMAGVRAADVLSGSRLSNPLGLNPFGGGMLSGGLLNPVDLTGPKPALDPGVMNVLGLASALPGADKADLNKLANKAIVGEVILVGGLVALAGIVAYVLTKREDMRPNLGSLVKLLGKGKG